MNDIAFSVIINNDGIDDIIFKTIMVKGEKGDGGTAIASIEKTSTSGNVDTYTVYLEDGSVAGTFTVTNAILPETATIEDVEIASFSDGADDVPVSELIVDIEPIETGSGEKSPSNPYTLSGWDECNVTREHFDHSDTETQTIDFGETTAFGGFLDVLNGKLTLTHAKYVYNSENIPTMSESSMSGTLGGKTRIFINQSGISRGGGSGAVDSEICDKYDAISSDVMYRGNQGISLRDNVTTGFYIYNPDIQGRTAWQQEISTNGLEVVAPLAEPIVVQLSKTQVRTLLNDNNIFADTGKIQKVTYFKTGCEALARLIDAFK